LLEYLSLFSRNLDCQFIRYKNALLFVLQIWNHPDILFTCMKKSLDDNDLDIETGEPKKKGGRGKSKKETPPATPNPEGAPSPGAVPGSLGQGPSVNIGRPNEPCITYDWVSSCLEIQG
jgi:hypothetical protein